MAGVSLDYKVFSGLCPDERCQTKLYFPVQKTVIECPNCGQTHSHLKIKDIEEVTDAGEAISQVIKSIVWDAKMPKKGSDSVKVHGLSNFHCKLLSPLFTRYGMDREGKSKLLSELGHGEIADCGRLLSSRAFLISPEQIDIVGYGRDRSGSVKYLKGLLEIIKDYHGGEERLVPIHADGDGHCLVHALSRATTGREIFWHALRNNLVSHLEKNLSTYKMMFQDFIDKDDWAIIIKEADPYHVSAEGFNVGLGNIHIFALANVLKRPIVLLDSLEGIKNVADYTGIFVPVLVEPSQCRNNMPLCVAWSGSGHNHFIPLIGVADKPLPSIPKSLLPNVWGVDKIQGERYLNFNEDGSLTVSGGKPLQTGYLLRLVSAMEQVFLERHGVAAGLVADMHLYVYKRVGFVGLHPDLAIQKTKEAVRNNQIFRCLTCNALTLSNVDEESLRSGGYLFEVMRDCHGKPRPDVVYSFPTEELQCKYDEKKECLVPYQFPCHWCRDLRLRRVDYLGNTMYENADVTTTPAEIPDQCCGFKHFWDGREYENVPKQFTLKGSFQGKSIEEQVVWFFGDSDPLLNSDSKKIAKDIALKHCGIDNPDLSCIVDDIREEILSNIALFGLTDESYAPSYDFVNKTGEMTNSPPCNFMNKTDGLSKTLSHDEKRKPEVPSQNLTVKCEDIKTVTVKQNDTPSTSKNDDVKKIMNSEEMTSSSLGSQQDKTGSSLPDTSSSNDTVRIRISTSDGRQETLTVDANLDYIGLQNTAQKHFNIAPNRQVLKHGFPPKQLDASKGKKALGLRNGDRIIVEIKKENVTKDKESGMKFINDTNALKIDHWQKGKNFYDKYQSGDALKAMRNDRHGSMDSVSVDNSLMAVSNMVKITGKNMWEYAVDHPELFRPGGTFYEQFARDIGLRDNGHCELPLIPGRVFRYNYATDCVELCLEPYGHYTIDSSVVDKVKRFEERKKISILPELELQKSDDEEPMDSQPEEVVIIEESPDIQMSNDENIDANEAMQTEDEDNSTIEVKEDAPTAKETIKHQENTTTNSEQSCTDSLLEFNLERLTQTVSEESKMQTDDVNTCTSKVKNNIQTIEEHTKQQKVTENLGRPSADNLIEISLEESSKTQEESKKIGPGFTTLGREPAVVNPEEAEAKRQQLLKMLEAKSK